jgi:hypothetical protein
MGAQPPPDSPLPIGYRQAVVTGITVPLTFSLVYFRFIVFELDSGPWTAWWVASAAVAAVSILAQFYSLWRALQLGDDRRAAYAVTVRCFGGGLLMLIVSLALSTAASLVD